MSPLYGYFENVYIKQNNFIHIVYINIPDKISYNVNN